MKRNDRSSSIQVLDAKFVKHCEEVLTDYIGPIATLVCPYILLSNPTLGKKELIATLSQHISQKEKVKAFQKQLEFSND